MCKRHAFDRRALLAGAAFAASAPLLAARAHASDAAFIREAFRMRDEAIAAGDQPYGAVVVLDGRIVGYGPSRVVTDRNLDAHAERVALWAAQKALGRQRLDGAVIYSSSVPCLACQRALAPAGITRMIHGRDMIDAGPPRGT
ncbi:MAG TPA: nucleoside deaminase [Hyphomicrobiaceae bacterium]|nr:nucleoside deaminase [Hyphomicrobiaceae bacterium]